MQKKYSFLTSLGFPTSRGVNKYHRYISAQGIAKALGKKKTEALPFFHAFTGCDTISFFNGIGKKKAWETWKVLPSLSKTFQESANCPDLLSFAMDESFVVILYSRTSECKFVKEVRNKLFVSGRQIENIRPAQDALIQHTKRAICEAIHIWNRTLMQQYDVPCPS